MALSNRHLEQIAVKKIPKVFNEECRGLVECCDDEWLVLHDQLDNVRWKNDVTSAFSLGDTVDFILKKNGVITTYTPLAVALPNEPNCYSTAIEWRDVFMSDGNGLFELSLDVTSAGVTVSSIWGNYNLLPYSDGSVINASGTTRILSYFNDYNLTEDIDFTGAFLKDSIRFKAFFGFWKPNTVVDNLVFEDGEKVKVSREDFFDYELRVDLHGKTVIDALLFHLRSENTCFITDHNAYNYSYNYLDYPVIVKSGFEPNWISGTRKVKGVAVFEDKKKRFKTSFNDDDNTGKFAPPTNVCLPSIITDGLNVVNVASGQSYTCVGEETPQTYNSAKIFKTGATISYEAGDDGDLEKGRGVDFFTLNFNNAFGNANKFTDIFGGQSYANGIVLDHSTDNGVEILGIDRAKLSGSGEQWKPNLTQSHSVGGFSSGWRLWNLKECVNFASNSNGIDFDYSPLNGTASQAITYWISRTYSFDPLYAFMYNGNGLITFGLKTNFSAINVPVRDFTYAELGL
jgi:hypothetical protein